MKSIRPFHRFLTTLVLLFLAGVLVHAGDRDWPSYLGDAGASHYSTLQGINRANVKDLAPVWIFHTGDATATSQIQCNPIIVDGVLYGSTAQHSLVALDGANGRELWRFNPFADEPGARARGVNRGVVLWRQGNARRLLYTAGHFLYALDPATGKRIESFGDNGRVDLLKSLDRDATDLFMVGTTPGVIYNDLIIISTRVGEGPGPAAPGHIRAYDVRTGQRRWIFHTIPQPGEFGYDTWPADAWQRAGGANAWAGLVVDQDRGIVFAPTGSATFDFWGGNRVGANLFANSLIALDARTGERKWHFQFVHHDIWDRDLPASPTLCTVRRNGKTIDAVAQITKSGHIWVFDRETGESLFPWREQPVPMSEVAGEVSWPTQPEPLKPAPFARQCFTEDEVTTLSPAAKAAVLERLRAATPHVPFSPPSTRGTIILPGFDGGGEWGGAAIDPSGVMYVNGNEMAWILQMIPTRLPGAGTGETIYNQLCVSCHGQDRRGNAAANIPNLVNIASRQKPAEIANLIGTGRGVMPAFGFLDPTQRTAIAEFLCGIAPTAIAASEEARHGGGDSPGLAADIPFTASGYTRFLDPEGYPALRPPWGTLNAIDLNTGEYLWRRPLGEMSQLTARGIPPTGTENYGGPLVTAGGLVFVAATGDEKFRAFDSATGEQVWETSLPAGGYATPATYAVDGRQYVVIACGGGKVSTKSGDVYMAFALPRTTPPVSAQSRVVTPPVLMANLLPPAPGTLKVRIIGADGTMLPARAWVENATGERFFRPSAPNTASPYQPDRSFSCDGWFEMKLPPGPIMVHVEKGKEFVPVNQSCTVPAGASVESTVVLERWVNMAEKGFYSADLHVHFGHDAPPVLRQLSLADDLNLIPAFTYWLQGNEKEINLSWPDWPDGSVTRVDASHFISRNNLEIERITRRDDATLGIGAAFLFNLKAPLAAKRFYARYPANAKLALEAKAASPDSVIDADKTTWAESVVGAALGAYDVAQICHNHYHRFATLAGGWGMVGPLTPEEKPLNASNELFRRTTTQYYHWLNCGIKIGVSGGSAMGVMPVPAGYCRTYAKVEGEFTPAKFWAAVKAGRTFATSGPMLVFQVNGQEMGATLHLAAQDSAPLEITARLQSIEAIDTIELIENGQVIVQERSSLTRSTSAIDQTFHWKIVPHRSCWYAVRALYTASDGHTRLAHTSPIYVTLDDKPIAVKASAEYLLHWIDQLDSVAKMPGRFQSDADRDETLQLYSQARAVYERAAASAKADWGD